MKIIHRNWPLSSSDSSSLALVEVLRKKGLLGIDNEWGSPDELLELSGGPTSELAQYSLLMGPPKLRAIARQPSRSMLPEGDKNGGSPLEGKPRLGPPPAPLRLEIEEWDGQQWKHKASHMGIDLNEVLRTLEDCTVNLPDLEQYLKLPVLPGSFAGCLSYDLVQWTQPWRLRNPPQEDAVLAVLWQVDRWLIHDRAASTLHLVGIEGDEWTNEMSSFLDSKPELILEKLDPVIAVEDEVSSHTDQQHAEIVRRVQSAITSGHLYQLNFGRTWSGELSQSPWELMRRLARDNPAPFSAWLHCQDLGLALCSSSPELLLSSDSGVLITRPIKGTRPRGENPSAEAELRLELLSDEKELAEHRMLVDLERNDIGLVAKAGSVEQSHFQVEAYAEVQHLVSEVRGMIRDDHDVWSALQAIFPGGSITGCPKTVTCAAIDLIEEKSRSFWTGSIGHIDHRTGKSAWNILIRTVEAWLGTERWLAKVQAGGGLVIGSDPETEVEEAKWKAAALRRAAGWLTVDNQSKLPTGEIAIYPQSINKPPLVAKTATGNISRWPDVDEHLIDGRARIIFVDNLDSFAWNIIHACAGLNANVVHVCGLTTKAEEWTKIIRATSATHVILGPGPGRPSNSELTQYVTSLAMCGKLLDNEGQMIPLLGICLGHQAIGEAAGMELVESPLGAVHGVPVEIIHTGDDLFSGLPNPVMMTRYNSLTILPHNSELEISAWDDTNTLPMAFAHRKFPIHSLQFHPESCGSEFGLMLLDAFVSRAPDIQPWASHG